MFNACCGCRTLLTIEHHCHGSSGSFPKFPKYFQKNKSEKLIARIPQNRQRFGVF